MVTLAKGHVICLSTFSKDFFSETTRLISIKFQTQSLDRGGKKVYIFRPGYMTKMPGRVAQSVRHLTRKSGVLASIPGLATYFHFSFRFFKKGSCQLLAKVCARSTVNRLGGLSLPRKSVVRLTDRPDMTLDVYRGRKTTIQLHDQDGRHAYIW